MNVNIASETEIATEITLSNADGDKVEALLKLDGGRWELLRLKTNTTEWIASGRVHYFTALNRALKAMAEDLSF